MSFGYIDNGLRKMCALILVGTIAGSATYGQMVSVGGNKDFAKSYYYDEDVKRNREELMANIENGGNTKAKTYGKKKELVPKTIKR